MGGIKIKCDRCGKEIEGIEIQGLGTAGFYRLTGSSWETYRRSPNEDVICDACMWADPQYIAIYGRHQ